VIDEGTVFNDIGDNRQLDEERAFLIERMKGNRAVLAGEEGEVGKVLEGFCWSE
jgi:hypothetical protein